LLPRLNAEADASIQHLSDDQLSSGSVFSGGNDRRESYAANLAVPSFDLDLFGKLRSMKKSAFEDYLASVEAQKAVRIALIGDVARAYQDHWFGDPSLSRGRRASMIVDPPDGRIPPLTPEAQARIAEKTEYLQALLQGTSGGRPGPISPRREELSTDYNLDRMNRADGPEDRSGGERCFGYNLPVFLQSGTFGGVARIVQSPDAVGINYDMGQGLGFSRSIPITDRPHLPSHVRQRYGDARAHWEGDTLVVDVTNFSQKTNFQGSRENLHLIERYRRLDANTLEVRVTIEDPTTFTGPFTAVQELTKNSDTENQVYEGACHEGNYGMIGMLVNTRAAETAFAEGRGPDPETQDNATGGGAISAAPDAAVR